MKYLFIALLAFFTSTAFSQVPQAFNYQGIARDAVGVPLLDRNIALRITLKEGGTPGLDVYKEIHQVQTNKLGLFSIEVGRGSSTFGLFNDIQWGAGQHFIQVEIDPNGGQNFTVMGTAQLLSVPYALYAGSTASQWQDNPKGIHYTVGSVGIGNANPTTLLTLEKNVSDGDDRWLVSLNNPSLSARSFSSMKLSAGNQTSQTDLTHHAETYDFDGDKYADFGQLRSSGRGLILRSDKNNSAIKFLVGNLGGINIQERMRITGEGYVGIGTETPQNKLSLAGNNALSSDAVYLSLQNQSLGNRSGVILSLSAGDDENKTTLSHHSETYDFDGDKYTDFGQLRSDGRGLILRSDENNSAIKFLVGNINGVNVLERMRITGMGFVGIGTGTPGSKLQVTGGDIFIENINSGIIMKSPDGNCWRVTIQNDGSLKPTSITCPN